jgi:hypothetical protein
MGLLDKFKEEGRGVAGPVPPQEGIEPQPADEVRRRLMAITGKGIEAKADGDDIVVSWSAKLASAGVFGLGKESLYRAFRISLAEADHEAVASTIESTDEGAAGPGGLSLSKSKSWGSGKQWGTQSEHVLSWGGPHRTEGGADESGYKFSWSDLREPVIDAVTGAGWTYRPK